MTGGDVLVFVADGASIGPSRVKEQAMKRSVRGAALAAVAVMAAGCGNGGNVFSLDVGTCFDDVAEFSEEGGGEVADVPVIDCEEPHDNEVFATFELEGDEFPETISEMADDGCLERFEPYVDRDYETSRFVISHLIPTSQTWTAGDREVVCFLYDLDFEKLEGSVEGSGE